MLIRKRSETPPSRTGKGWDWGRRKFAPRICFLERHRPRQRWGWVSHGSDLIRHPTFVISRCMNRFASIFISIIGSLLICGSARAEVKLNGLFTDCAVLQRDREIPIWGTGRDGEKVTVKLAGEEASTTVKDGRWMLKL